MAPRVRGVPSIQTKGLNVDVDVDVYFEKHDKTISL